MAGHIRADGGREPSAARRICRVLSAVTMVLALHADINVIQGAGSDFAPAELLSKLNSSFYGFEFYDLLALLLMPPAYRYLDEKGGGRDFWAVLMAALFSVSALAAMSIRNAGSLGFFYANAYQRLYSALCLLGWFSLFYLLLRLLYTMAENAPLNNSPSPRSGRALWLTGFAVIFICWLPWTLANYPGTFCQDSYSQVRQALGAEPWTAYSPVFSSWLMGLAIKLGGAVIDRNFGCWLYLLMQTVIGAAVFSYSIKKLHELGVRTGGCIAGLAFFALTPLWGCFAQFYEKDLLYAELAALNLVLAVGVIRARRCGRLDALMLGLSGILMALARNNGIFAALPLLLALALYLKRTDRRRAVCAFCAVFALYAGIKGALYPALGIEKGSMQDLFCIPFQQTARYISSCGDEVTRSEREAIDGVIDYAAAADYKPANADPVKYTYKDDPSKLPAYFKAWLGMGLKHPGVYLEAFIAKSYGYLAPVETNRGAYVLSCAEPLNEYGIFDTADAGTVEAFEYLSWSGTKLPIVNNLYKPGLYTWLALGCAALLLKHRRYAALLPFIPAAVNIIFCIGSPLHNAIRYALPLVASMPLLLGWTVCELRVKTDTGSTK